MVALILDGRLVSNILHNNIKMAIKARKNKGLKAPGLAVILVGDDMPSRIYVTNKRKACLELGLNSHDYDLPNNVSETALLDLITDLNDNQNIDGILVQLPLPTKINTSKIIECINPLKDVDGFHPYNIGRLAQQNPFLRPCTPYGIIKLLNYYKIMLKGKHAVIVGDSNIVGRPMALEFLLAGATVTICHRFTTNLAMHVQRGDIIVSATGARNIVNVDWLRGGQVVVDVGIQRDAQGKLCGDLNFDQAQKKVAWITPVPGGVGPMTIACLLENTLFAAEQVDQDNN